jgi:hypothetical protein
MLISMDMAEDAAKHYKKVLSICVITLRYLK